MSRNTNNACILGPQSQQHVNNQATLFGKQVELTRQCWELREDDGAGERSHFLGQTRWLRLPSARLIMPPARIPKYRLRSPADKGPGMA